MQVRKKGAYLRQEDRLQIEMMRREGRSLREIEKATGISKSAVQRANSVARELGHRTRLSPYEQAHYATEQARLKASLRRKGKKKVAPESELLRGIAKELRVKKRSPEQISMTSLEVLGIKLSKQTIYRIIESERPELVQYLPEQGKARRSRVMHRRSPFLGKAAPVKRTISARNEELNEVRRLGDLEGDTIISSKEGAGGVVNLVDRRTRKSWAAPVANLESETVKRVILKLLTQMPLGYLKTVTFDRGSEFALWFELEAAVPGLKVYFCDARRPDQKGSNERNNREYRRHFPKGTDLSKVRAEDFMAANGHINTRPMKVLGGQSPDQAFDKLWGQPTN